jgi:hypothetical protein
VQGWTRLRELVRQVPRRYWVALLVYVALAAIFVHDWDGYVFATAARQLLHGHTPYEVAESDPWYGYLNPTDRHVQWYAYPPLPLLLMAVTYAPAVFLHLPPWAGRILLKVPVIVGTLALAAVAGRYAGRLGADAAGQRKIELRFLTNPFLVLVGPVWGMTDTLLMALYLGGVLAYSNGRHARAGVLVALATLVKPFPVLLLLALTPYLLARDGWTPFRRFAAWAGGTGLVLSAPFLLLDARGYWHQAVAAHLARDPQGLTVWSLWPLKLLPAAIVSPLSLALMAGALLAIGVAATRLRGKGTSMVLTLAAAVAVLVFNRVVNEQYLVLAVAPMLILDVAHRLDKFGHLLTRWTSTLFAVAIAILGFHFLTFIPPDLATPILHVPVDYAAEQVRRAAPEFWAQANRILERAVPLTLAALGVLAARLMRDSWVRAHADDPRTRSHLAPTAGACLLLLLLGLAPLVQPVAGGSTTFHPATAEPHVAAFYYLWWQNPAHDPAINDGNWGPVSEHSSMGYYTTTRGVARDHVRMMLENGIDTAYVSYHRGELERYKVFQEEAAAQGLRVAPLIELNQVYDQADHHPVDEGGVKVPYAAYRLDNGTRQAIEQFVLDLKPQLQQPSSLRIDGRPVVLFYDSYVSGVSFLPQDQLSLAQTLFGMMPTQELREAFKDPGIVRPEDLLRHHPTVSAGFYDPGNASLWRRAHLEQHVQFWRDARAELEAQLGPLYLVSGDALNERAGFAAGTVKSLVGLEVFDGAFIYSPSFTWGNQPTAPFEDTFALWEDRDAWLSAFGRGRAAFTSFGIAPAYDDTVNRHSKGFAISAFPPGDQTFYERGWASAIGQAPTMPAVATFNEFFEGSSIEPSVEYGPRFLNDTAVERARFLAAPLPTRNVTVLVHERSSRTSLDFSETDLSHFWGLDLLAAADRAVPNARSTAIDALEPALGPLQRPDLLLVEGGRGTFAASPAALAALASWSGTTPSIVFGPDLATSLHGSLGDDCLAGLSPIPDPKTLAPGDTLKAGNGTLELDRDGVAYVVGRTCEPGLRAGTSAKPWIATDPLADPWGGSHDRLDAQCMAVALRALMPAFAAPDAPTSCHVPV